MTDIIDISAVTESITCPITGDVMVDPVQGSDGQTYEKTAILEALKYKQESPITRQPMTENDLKVNASIRFLCDKFHSGAFGNVVKRDKPSVSNGTILLDHNTSKTVNSNNVMIEFNVNKDSFPTNLEAGHLSQDIVLVIDHSGSMNSPVEAKDADGNNLENGMSIQDIVNHAAKTVAKTLDTNSRLAVIAFDSVITLTFDLMLMTDLNKVKALDSINSIMPQYQTNIWGGIVKAIEILDQRSDKTRNSAILMFTDGQPNISPARGEVETLKRLRNTKNFTTPIYTFGFGYNLQQDLLYDIAKYGNGGNGHIPDGGMIATVFCNFTGTILSTVVLNLQLHILTHGVTLMGDYAFNNNTSNPFNEMVYDLGTVQYEQSRNIILNLNTPNGKVNEVEYYYTYKIGGAPYKSDNIKLNVNTLNTSPEINSHINRYKLVESIRKMSNYNTCNMNSEAMNEFANIKTCLGSSDMSNVLNKGLLANLVGNGSNEGQIQMAVGNMVYFKRWGVYYLDQLARSLNQQMKPNFKDEGCVFGGENFNNIVDRSSDIFDTLPPPSPSLITRSHGSNNSSSTPMYRGLSNPAPINMSAYNDPHGGCFDSNCSITMSDGSIKSLNKVKKGDKVMTATLDNTISQANVVCVYEMKNEMGIREFVDLDNGLYITPWHPIKYNNKWVFPADIKDPVIKTCYSIITLVLDKHHIGFINGHQCIMLGHGYTNGVLNHPFYGTQKVIDCLKSHYGWEEGHVCVNDRDVDISLDKNLVNNMCFKNMNIRSPPVLSMF